MSAITADPSTGLSSLCLPDPAALCLLTPGIGWQGLHIYNGAMNGAGVEGWSECDRVASQIVPHGSQEVPLPMHNRVRASNFAKVKISETTRAFRFDCENTLRNMYLVCMCRASFPVVPFSIRAAGWRLAKREGLRR